jgi:hypothetical protein
MSRAAAVLALVFWATAVDGRQPSRPSDEDLSILSFLQAVETAISTSNRDAWLALLSPTADRDQAIEFFEAMVPQGVTRAVIRERDRAALPGTLPGDGYRLVVEVFLETGQRGRIATWRLDIRRPRGEPTERQPWRILSEDRLSSVEGLHRLTLNAEKQFAARDLTISAVDFELHLPQGNVFVAETAEGVTGLVLLGDGIMSFAPAPKEERTQLRIFAGTEALEAAFGTAFVRLNPFEFDQRVREGALAPVSIDSRELRRAQTVFDEEIGKSFSLDLSDMSRETWSLLPQAGDLLAEVRTRRFDMLTYARSTGEAEDVTLFHRARKRNIASYASEQKLSSRGRFYNEDDLVEYDVLDYQIDATFHPDREWLEGRARVKLRVKAFVLAALTLRLAEDFTVNSVISDELGRLLFLRVKNQNGIVINLPTPVPRDLELTLAISYQGRLARQPIDQESLEPQGAGRSPQRPEDIPFVPAEPNWLLSNRSHWYPQSQVTDYATATIRFTVPSDYSVVASGDRVPDTPLMVVPPGPNQVGRVLHMFTAQQPARYLGVVISKFLRADAATVALDVVPLQMGVSTATNGRGPTPAPPSLGLRNTVELRIEANRRQEPRGRDLLPTAAEIMRLYARLVGDVPYGSVTLAMTEHDLPGGHSPPYFAVINNPLPTTPFVWRSDPAAFQNFPEFFVAHELAHQWWGQAVGWKNYHEQWLSEGFAQYFAALYAKERRGEEAFRDILKQLRRWAMDQSDQGPVYLGYRLGHIKSDTRVFRALVYNKGASVLHMLRRVVGDDAFFRGLRRFYAENRFRKAGTHDLQRAMEHESGKSLERFFERWIYDVGLPRVRASTVVEGQDLVVRLEQQGDVFDLPVLVTISYTDGRTEEHLVVSKEPSVETRIRLAASLRQVEFNQDNATLGTIERR